MEKKYNFVYQTTNLLNGKIYIGVHSTNKLNDGYIGSGTRFSDAKKCYGTENFKREILEFFETRLECYQKEKELVTSEFILRKDTYNITEGGYGVITHSPDGLQKLSDSRTNQAVMKDKNGKIISIDRNDPNFLNLVGHTAGMVCAKDENSDEIFISKEIFDSRDDLVGRTKGQMHVSLLETGKTILIDVDNYNKKIHKRFSTDKIAVKDKDGNTFQVSKNDERYLKGELVGVMKGTSYKKSKDKQLTCPHCNLTSNAGNIKRWHFDNCKFK